MDDKLKLVSYPEKEGHEKGFVVLLEKNPKATKQENNAYTKRIGCVEGRGRSIKEARNDFLAKNADVLVSVTSKTIDD
ncbi:MAG: hypothetical protein HGA67_00565 [Candidatus Yonathbacteria bacterium]|nr:hypothetical protein [Candidatus Yonathbacteria bacterium]